MMSLELLLSPLRCRFLHSTTSCPVSIVLSVIASHEDQQNREFKQRRRLALNATTTPQSKDIIG